MVKYTKIFLDILNNTNFQNLKFIDQKTDCAYVFLSKLDIFSLKLEDLDDIKQYFSQENRFFVPSKENYLSVKNWRKRKELTIFLDWMVCFPHSTQIVLSSNIPLFVSNENEDWNKNYDGNLGYAITANNTNSTIYYKYSASIGNNSDIIKLRTFDGAKLIYLLVRSNR